MSEYAFVISTDHEFSLGICESRALVAVAGKVRAGQASWTAARPLGALTYKVDRYPLVGGVLKDPDNAARLGDAHSQGAWARAELFAAEAKPDEAIQAWAKARLRILAFVTRTPWSEGAKATGSLLSRAKIAPALVCRLMDGHAFTNGPVALGGGHAYVVWRFGSPVAACVVRHHEGVPEFTILVRFSARQTDVRILADYLRFNGLTSAADYAKAHAHEAPVFA